MIYLKILAQVTSVSRLFFDEQSPAAVLPTAPPSLGPPQNLRYPLVDVAGINKQVNIYALRPRTVAGTNE
jgi:hypothetical protein